jgi:hypothetical protein
MTGLAAHDWLESDQQASDGQAAGRQAMNRQSAAGAQAPDWEPQPDGAARPDERQSQYVPVECQECGAVVLAAKFSVQHTSVQWDAAAVRQCAEFARRTAVGDRTPLIERCNGMRASIEGAALEGRLPVTPP